MERTKTTLIMSVLKVEYKMASVFFHFQLFTNKTSLSNNWINFSSSNSASVCPKIYQYVLVKFSSKNCNQVALQYQIIPPGDSLMPNYTTRWHFSSKQITIYIQLFKFYEKWKKLESLQAGQKGFVQCRSQTLLDLKTSKLIPQIKRQIFKQDVSVCLYQII